MKPSTLAQHMLVRFVYVTTFNPSGDITFTATLEKVDGELIDQIRWELDETGLVEGPIHDIGGGPGGVVTTSPSPDLAQTGFNIDPSPPAGDLSPRPLNIGSNVGQEMVLRLACFSIRLIAVQWAEMYEAEI